MNPIYILIAIAAVPILLLLTYNWWLNKHKFIFKEYIWEGGIKRIKAKRFRVVNGYFYTMGQILENKPLLIDKFKYTFYRSVTPFYSYLPYFAHKSMLFSYKKTEYAPLTYDMLQEFIIPIESGWGGPNNVCRFNEDPKYRFSKPWTLPDASNIAISNDMVIKINELREELYESTKNPLSTQELLAKVLVPLGLIILAIICVVFFPKIYETIQNKAVADYSAARQAIVDLITANKPVG